jgi:hypothetical protein
VLLGHWCFQVSGVKAYWRKGSIVRVALKREFLPPAGAR